QGRRLIETLDLAGQGIAGRGELALLVKFPVVGDIGLRNDPEDAPAGKDHGAVEQSPLQTQRRTHHQDRRPRARGLDERRQPLLNGPKQRFLLVQILEGISRKRQLREQDDRGAVPRGRVVKTRDLLRFGGRLGELYARWRDVQARKILRTEIE